MLSLSNFRSREQTLNLSVYIQVGTGYIWKVFCMVFSWKVSVYRQVIFLMFVDCLWIVTWNFVKIPPSFYQITQKYHLLREMRHSFFT